MALGMAGCGKKAYKTFPEKYKLASVDVGGMTADEAKKAIKLSLIHIYGTGTASGSTTGDTGTGGSSSSGSTSSGNTGNNGSDSSSH